MRNKRTIIYLFCQRHMWNLQSTTLANSSVLDSQMHVWFSHVFQFYKMIGESRIHKQALFIYSLLL